MPRMNHARIFAPLLLSLAVLPLLADEPSSGWPLWSFDTEG